MIPHQSLLENLAKRARRPEGAVAAIAHNRHPFATRLDRSGAHKSALYYILDYIVRTDTEIESDAIIIDN